MKAARTRRTAAGIPRRLLEDLRRALASLEYLEREARKDGGDYGNGAAMGYAFGAAKIREIIHEYAGEEIKEVVT